MTQENQILILVYIISLVLNLIYFIFGGEEDVKDVRTLLFSGYTLAWILPLFNTFSLLFILIYFFIDAVEKIKISKVILEKINKFLKIKLPINRK